MNFIFGWHGGVCFNISMKILDLRKPSEGVANPLRLVSPCKMQEHMIIAYP